MFDDAEALCFIKNHLEVLNLIAFNDSKINNKWSISSMGIGELVVAELALQALNLDLLEGLIMFASLVEFVDLFVDMTDEQIKGFYRSLSLFLKNSKHRFSKSIMTCVLLASIFLWCNFFIIR